MFNATNPQSIDIKQKTISFWNLFASTIEAKKTVNTTEFIKTHTNQLNESELLQMGTILVNLKIGDQKLRYRVAELIFHEGYRRSSKLVDRNERLKILNKFKLQLTLLYLASEVYGKNPIFNKKETDIVESLETLARQGLVRAQIELAQYYYLKNEKEKAKKYILNGVTATECHNEKFLLDEQFEKFFADCKLEPIWKTLQEISKIVHDAMGEWDNTNLCHSVRNFISSQMHEQYRGLTVEYLPTLRKIQRMNNASLTAACVKLTTELRSSIFNFLEKHLDSFLKDTVNKIERLEKRNDVWRDEKESLGSNQSLARAQEQLKEKFPNIYQKFIKFTAELKSHSHMPTDVYILGDEVIEDLEKGLTHLDPNDALILSIKTLQFSVLNSLDCRGYHNITENRIDVTLRFTKIYYELMLRNASPPDFKLIELSNKIIGLINQNRKKILEQALGLIDDFLDKSGYQPNKKLVNAAAIFPSLFYFLDLKLVAKIKQGKPIVALYDIINHIIQLLNDTPLHELNKLLSARISLKIIDHLIFTLLNKINEQISLAERAKKNGQMENHLHEAHKPLQLLLKLLASYENLELAILEQSKTLILRLFNRTTDLRSSIANLCQQVQNKLAELNRSNHPLISPADVKEVEDKYQRFCQELMKERPVFSTNQKDKKRNSEDNDRGDSKAIDLLQLESKALRVLPPEEEKSHLKLCSEAQRLLIAKDYEQALELYASAQIVSVQENDHLKVIHCILEQAECLKMLAINLRREVRNLYKKPGYDPSDDLDRLSDLITKAILMAKESFDYCINFSSLDELTSQQLHEMSELTRGAKLVVERLEYEEKDIDDFSDAVICYSRKSIKDHEEQRREAMIRLGDAWYNNEFATHKFADEALYHQRVLFGCLKVQKKIRHGFKSVTQPTLASFNTLHPPQREKNSFHETIKQIRKQSSKALVLFSRFTVPQSLSPRSPSLSDDVKAQVNERERKLYAETIELGRPIEAERTTTDFHVLSTLSNVAQQPSSDYKTNELNTNMETLDSLLHQFGIPGGSFHFVQAMAKPGCGNNIFLKGTLATMVLFRQLKISNPLNFPHDIDFDVVCKDPSKFLNFVSRNGYQPKIHSEFSNLDFDVQGNHQSFHCQCTILNSAQKLPQADPFTWMRIRLRVSENGAIIFNSDTNQTVINQIENKIFGVDWDMMRTNPSVKSGLTRLMKYYYQFNFNGYKLNPDGNFPLEQGIISRVTLQKYLQNQSELSLFKELFGLKNLILPVFDDPNDKQKGIKHYHAIQEKIEFLRIEIIKALFARLSPKENLDYVQLKLFLERFELRYHQQNNTIPNSLEIQSLRNCFWETIRDLKSATHAKSKENDSAADAKQDANSTSSISSNFSKS